MSIYNRENQYINLLAQKPHSVKELSQKLFISEPTVRRDIILLLEKNLVTRKRGIITLKTNPPDQRIPLFIRHFEQNQSKQIIAQKASLHIKDGYVIMLDASTTAFHLLPHLTQFKNILVITNGGKTALESASLGIKTICTGGEMTLESFSYVGSDAEKTLMRYNADVAFFSCRGVSDDGIVSDNSILENSMRRIMIKNSKKSYLLCDTSKFGKIYLNTLCHSDEIEKIISNK
ncbi:MAG: DeoR/GlpR transcriptional regulator [Ruminococcaceae bacterium]|nr:DeoR/GlpR transcriptional regulator [Oscillospiraceae bacterium]